MATSLTVTTFNSVKQEVFAKFQKPFGLSCEALRLEKAEDFTTVFQVLLENYAWLGRKGFRIH